MRQLNKANIQEWYKVTEDTEKIKAVNITPSALKETYKNLKLLIKIAENTGN